MRNTLYDADRLDFIDGRRADRSSTTPPMKYSMMHPTIYIQGGRTFSDISYKNEWHS